MSNLSTDYDVRLATLKKLGGDMSKKYATIYDVDLAILEKTGQGGGGGDVELKTFGGKSLKGQGEFLEDYSGIPSQGDVLGVTEQLYRPKHFEQQISYPEEYQNAYSYKFIDFYNNNAYNMPTPEFFILYVKKTQEDFGTLLLYENYDLLNLRTTFVCTEDFTDMKTYQMRNEMYFYNSNSLFRLTETELSKIELDTQEETFKNFIQWLRTNNFNKQILTQNSTTIISDDSGNLYKIPENDFSIPQPVSFTNYSSELRCNTDNMFYMYDNNMGIIYKRDENNNILYCSDDNVADFKVLDSFVSLDSTPKIYQYFELQLSENESSYSYHLVSPNNGKCYFIYKTYSEEGVETVSLREGSSPYALSGFDLSSEVDGYINTENGIILRTGNFLTKHYISDFLYDYKLGFVTQNPGISEWEVQNIADQKATEKIEEFKNSGYIENVATEKATQKVDSELYNITTQDSELNVKDYAENDLNDTQFTTVNAQVPYSNPNGNNSVTLIEDITDCVWSSEQTQNSHKALYRILYNGERAFEIGLYRKDDGDVAPTVKCVFAATNYFAPGSMIVINDESGNRFEISDFENQSSYKLDQVGLTGKKIWINYFINSSISATSLDFEICTGAMRNWIGGVNHSNLSYANITTTKTAKYATKEELNGKANTAYVISLDGRINSVEQSVANKVDNSSIWSGTQAEWDALPVETQNTIKIALITE